MPRRTSSSWKGSPATWTLMGRPSLPFVAWKQEKTSVPFISYKFVKGFLAITSCPVKRAPPGKAGPLPEHWWAGPHCLLLPGNKRKLVYCAFHVLVQPNFWWYYFYFLPDQAQIHLQRFRRTLLPNFVQIRQRVKNLPACGRFVQWGSMGMFFICCRIQLKFCLRVRLKR